MPDTHADCNIIIDPAPRTGAENMQIDEQHLASVVAGDCVPLVRIYEWRSPTISLGYFQKSVPVPSHFSECSVVRRLTGGGAILHDQEITYSIALPAGHRFRAEPVAAYDAVHNAIIQLLQDFSVTSELRMNSKVAPSTAAKDEFLCFLRADPRDVVLGPHKIVGSAQRRRKGSVLQHGSILLRKSILAPEVLGIQDFAPNFPDALFKAQLGQAIAAAIQM